ncbi:hypothetical protein H6G17_29170 [Chroococcidiopsis sp. FACHB-1243]|uniref:hypothetical protein n=1 Tax=Chroococcidiopsis sp. [FACHB-1243] TaxID=2692781 RepID=UPI0018EF5DD9|nr:hypothetical protein [Chroococcidiopsis sp. [FACHB-1243]]MBD2309518.1 hypothetical protein [Chroococcidiopsis sp. [FACHB-1243]]
MFKDMRADYQTRFRSTDNASDLAKQATGVKLPKEIDAVIRALPVAERSAWLRRVISEAAEKELLNKSA